MPNPSRQRYSSARLTDPVTWSDVLSILDSHGLRLTPGGHGARSVEAKVVRRLLKEWLRLEGVRCGPPYVMPLRVLAERISHLHRELIALPGGGVCWAVVVDAINDPNGGLDVVRLRYARAAS